MLHFDLKGILSRLFRTSGERMTPYSVDEAVQYPSVGAIQTGIEMNEWKGYLADNFHMLCLFHARITSLHPEMHLAVTEAYQSLQ